VIVEKEPALRPFQPQPSDAKGISLWTGIRAFTAARQHQVFTGFSLIFQSLTNSDPTSIYLLLYSANPTPGLRAA